MTEHWSVSLQRWGADWMNKVKNVRHSASKPAVEGYNPPKPPEAELQISAEGKARTFVTCFDGKGEVLFCDRKDQPLSEARPLMFLVGAGGVVQPDDVQCRMYSKDAWTTLEQAVIPSAKKADKRSAEEKQKAADKKAREEKGIADKKQADDAARQARERKEAEAVAATQQKLRADIRALAAKNLAMYHDFTAPTFRAVNKGDGSFFYSIGSLVTDIWALLTTFRDAYEVYNRQSHNVFGLMYNDYAVAFNGFNQKWIHGLWLLEEKKAAASPSAAMAAVTKKEFELVKQADLKWHDPAWLRSPAGGKCCDAVIRCLRHPFAHGQLYFMQCTATEYFKAIGMEKPANIDLPEDWPAQKQPLWFCTRESPDKPIDRVLLTDIVEFRWCLSLFVWSFVHGDPIGRATIPGNFRNLADPKDSMR